MADPKQPSAEQLHRRRKEILEQMDRLRDDVPGALDRDPEEQAIEVEHGDVFIAAQENLRTELIQVEERLTNMGETF